MKIAIINKKLEMMSDGKKTHVVTLMDTLSEKDKMRVSTNMGKGVGVKRLKSHLRRMGYIIRVK